MKVLFVCQRNNGRSQIAKAIYNKLTGSSDADSAGTEVNKDGQLLKERAAEPGSELSSVFAVLQEADIYGVADYPRTQLRPESLGNYDRVVAIMNPAVIPDYLRSHQKLEVWDIDDPKQKDLDGVRATRDQIHKKIEAFIQY